MVKVKKIKVIKKKVPKKVEVEEKVEVEPEEVEENEVDSEGDGGETEQSHRKQLEEIAKKDPEFFKFLQQEDADLLDFNDSDVEMAEDFDDEEEEEEPASEEIMIGNKKLELEVEEDRKVVSMEVAQLLEKVMSNPFEKRAQLKPVVGLAVGAFNACVSRVGANIDKGDYVVKHDGVFDSVIRTCLKHMGHCLLLLLNPQDEDQKKTKKVEKKKKKTSAATVFKFFHKYKTLTKRYLIDLVELLSEVGQKEMVVAITRSIMELSDLYPHFPKTCRQLIKNLVRLWSQKSMEERCSAFLALNRISKISVDMYTFIYKSCYVAYVSVSRNVNSGSWQFLSFMQKSFAELTFANPGVSYQYVFVYVRQYAIHLRNAKITKRKDVVKSVYNWQYVLGLYLWSTVMTRSDKHRGESEAVDWIRELRYPLIQIIIGLINVFPTARYIPLRLHCVRILLQLQVNCSIYIPTLSVAVDLLEDLNTIDLKKPSNAKTTQRTSPIKDLVRLSKEMFDDVNYRGLIADEVFEICLEAAYVIRNSIAFTEITRPILPILRNFVKHCRNLDHKRLFKGLDNKIREHIQTSSLTLAAHRVDLKDPNSLYKLEQILLATSTPLAEYHDTYHKTRENKRKYLEEVAKANPIKTYDDFESDDDEDDGFRKRNTKKLTAKRKFKKIK